MRANYKVLQVPEDHPMWPADYCTPQKHCEVMHKGFTFSLDHLLWLPRHAHVDGDTPPGPLPWACAPQIVFAPLALMGQIVTKERENICPKVLNQQLLFLILYFIKGKQPSTGTLMCCSWWACSLCRLKWLWCSSPLSCTVMQWGCELLDFTMATVQWKINCATHVVCTLVLQAACSYIS